MSAKVEVRYDMTVEGCKEDRERFHDAMERGGISPDYFEMESDDGDISAYSTPADLGTTEQWFCLDETMGKLIAGFPALRITIWESDEEPHIVSRRLDYADGQLVNKRYGAIYGPDDDWQGELLREVMGELGKKGYFDAINLIQEIYGCGQ